MKTMNVYLTFDGTCSKAMKFYQKCLSANLEMMPFSQMPASETAKLDANSKDRVMHARLTKGAVTLMASDSMPGTPIKAGNNFSISIDCSSKAEVDELVAALKEGGQVTMPAADTFWGAYFAMVTDQFGVGWMFNYDQSKTA